MQGFWGPAQETALLSPMGIPAQEHMGMPAILLEAFTDKGQFPEPCRFPDLHPAAEIAAAAGQSGHFFHRAAVDRIFSDIQHHLARSIIPFAQYLGRQPHGQRFCRHR